MCKGWVFAIHRRLRPSRPFRAFKLLQVGESSAAEGQHPDSPACFDTTQSFSSHSTFAFSPQTQEIFDIILQDSDQTMGPLSLDFGDINMDQPRIEEIFDSFPMSAEAT